MGTFLPPVYAQEVQPGDACVAGETDFFRRVGGPENSGSGHFLVCDGTNWHLIIGYDTETGTVRLSTGETSQRPSSPVNGMLRYNSQTDKFEGYQAGSWQDIITAAAGAGGADRQIQFNNAGALAGDATFVFTSAGYVGIGTNTPSHILTIASDSGQDLRHYSYSAGPTAGPDYEMVRSASGTVGVDAAVRADDKLGGFRARGYDGTVYEIGAMIEMYVDSGATVADEDMPTHMRFATRDATDNVPVERMRLTSDGKLGIGTASPGYHVIPAS